MTKRKVTKASKRPPRRPARKGKAQKLVLKGRTVTERYGLAGVLLAGHFGAAPERHEELAKYHARAAGNAAVQAWALARTGKCDDAVRALLEAAKDYGRSDAHSGGNPDKAAARREIAAATSGVQSCGCR